MRSAFSTVACPAWTLDRVCRVARELRYDGVELRTFGYGSTQLACDPAHTCPKKLSRMFDEAGVAIDSLATSLRFDQPVTPPVIGRALGDFEGPVRSGKMLIDLARDLGCRYVRVFGFQKHGHERLSTSARRIGERLFKLVDHSRNTGVRVLLENGGSFATGQSLEPIIDEADLQGLLGVSYSPMVARAAGESIERGLDRLGDRICVVKVNDVRGEGAIRALREQGYDGWVVHDDDQLWAGSQTDPVDALRDVPAVVMGHRQAG